MIAAKQNERDVVAAAWKGRPGCIALDQAKLLLRAAQWVGMSARDLAEVMNAITGRAGVEEITPDGFVRLMDYFLGQGFRHPAVPMLTAAQLSALRTACVRLSLDARTFVRTMREVTGVSGRRHLEGSGFAALMEYFNARGAGIQVASARHMDRTSVGIMHLALHHSGMTTEHFGQMRLHFGGVARTGMLDRRAYVRMLHGFAAWGVQMPASPPRITPRQGMITQAQANLIWRLWCEGEGRQGDTSRHALGAAIGAVLGFGGGLETLTLAGARVVIDRFLAPRLKQRASGGGSGREEWPGRSGAAGDRGPNTSIASSNVESAEPRRSF